MLGFLNFRRRHRQRDLASVLIGEVTATLEAIEEFDEVKQLEAGDAEAERHLSELSTFRLPPSPVYNFNIGRLHVLDASSQRQVTYFYTRVASLADHLRALSKVNNDPDVRKDHARNALVEIQNAMNAGDDLLRTLRLHVSRRQPATITRA